MVRSLAVLMVVLVACGDDSSNPDVGTDVGVDAPRDTGTDVVIDAAFDVLPCIDDDECDDGNFCNGVETCEMGTCAWAEAPACGELGCDPVEERCVTNCAADADADDDGQDSIDCGGNDCDDTRPWIYMGADEIPGSGADEDCDGMELCFADQDDDGYRTDVTNMSSNLDCSGESEAGDEVPSGDCDDGSADINPGAEEIIADGVDQSCDGIELCYADLDADGFRPDETSVVASTDDLDCFDPGEADGTFSVGDCDDADPLKNPAAAEVAGDEVDQNCDGMELCFVDADRDGYRPDGTATVESPNLSCADAGEASYLTDAGDCADDDDARHPSAVETCNGIDDDCSGRVDQRLNTVVVPLGWQPLRRRCGTNVGRCESGYQRCVGGDWETTCRDDTPPRGEICDGTVDDDCDGATDEGCGCTAGMTRACGPSTGACSRGTQTCTVGGSWGTCVGYTGPTDETCNGLDDDCNGTVDDENTPGCIPHFIDVDGDGVGDRTEPSRCLCGPVGDYTEPENCVGPPGPVPCIPWRSDCNDDDATTYPGAREVCDTVDHDCDGDVHEEDAMGCTRYYADFDRDGYGSDEADDSCTCDGPPIYWFDATRSGDCCDIDGRANPGTSDYSSRAAYCGGYDFDCDGSERKRWTNLFGCHDFCTRTDQGWFSATMSPTCGTRDYWVTLCAPPLCIPTGHWRTQQCR